jgi:prolyl 4-hydroxylase
MLIRTIDNFISNEDCQKLINYIDSNHSRSMVVSATGNELHDARTSSTCNLLDSDDIIQNIKEKISKELKIPTTHFEPIQGQLYEPGQFFKQHYDWFDNEGYELHGGTMGNRNWTVMIYLNDDCEGGQTKFPNLDLEFTPKTGMAVVWQNMVKGVVTEDALHEGCEVIEGKKYIITLWVRENSTIPQSLIEIDTPKIISNTFSTHSDIPKFTTNGFLKIKLSDENWKLVQEMYEAVKDTKIEEVFNGKEGIILGENNTSDILSLENVPHLKVELHKNLLELHKQWCGTEIEPTFIYGIRSYNTGARLAQHYDRIETHHISSIICVDKELGDCNCNDWALDVMGHDGNWHKVYMEPGEILLYESAAVLHGRDEPFKGNFYRGMFIHYKLKNYEYKPAA